MYVQLDVLVRVLPRPQPRPRPSWKFFQWQVGNPFELLLTSYKVQTHCHVTRCSTSMQSTAASSMRMKKHIYSHHDYHKIHLLITRLFCIPATLAPGNSSYPVNYQKQGWIQDFRVGDGTVPQTPKAQNWDALSAEGEGLGRKCTPLQRWSCLGRELCFVQK